MCGSFQIAASFAKHGLPWGELQHNASTAGYCGFQAHSGDPLTYASARNRRSSVPWVLKGRSLHRRTRHPCQHSAHLGRAHQPPGVADQTSCLNSRLQAPPTPCWPLQISYSYCAANVFEHDEGREIAWPKTSSHNVVLGTDGHCSGAVSSSCRCARRRWSSNATHWVKSIMCYVITWAYKKRLAPTPTHAIRSGYCRH